MIRGLAKREPPRARSIEAGSMPRTMVLVVVVILMTSACTSDVSNPRQVAVTPIAGPLDAPRMSVPRRPHVCRETAQTFGFRPGEACFSDAYSLFTWHAFQNPQCFGDEPVAVTVARNEQVESPDRFITVDLQSTEDCSDPLDGLAVVVSLESDEIGAAGPKAHFPPALVVRSATNGSIVGRGALLVTDSRGDAMLPMEVPWVLDGEAEE